jgi:hypothetical protein
MSQQWCPFRIERLTLIQSRIAMPGHSAADLPGFPHLGLLSKKRADRVRSPASPE